MLKRVFIASIFLAFSSFAVAATYSSAEHVRIGSKVVDVGDKVTRFQDAAEPTKKVPLINAYGVKLGERWLYDRGGGSWTVIELDNYGTVTGVLDMIDR